MFVNAAMIAMTALSYPGMCERPAVEADEYECLEHERLQTTREEYFAFYERHPDSVPVSPERIQEWARCLNDELTLQRGESGRAKLHINWDARYMPVVTLPEGSQNALVALETEHMLATPGLGTGEAPLMCLQYSGGSGIGKIISENPRVVDSIDTTFSAFIHLDVHSSELSPGTHTFKINVTSTEVNWRDYYNLECELKVIVEGEDPNDLDGDGVPNDQDECSDTCEGASTVNNAGCDLAQVCACDNNWCDEGSYVECVRGATRTLRREGKITRTQRRDLINQADQSGCGARPVDDNFDDLWNCEIGFDLEDSIWNWDWVWDWGWGF